MEGDYYRGKGRRIADGIAVKRRERSEQKLEVAREKSGEGKVRGKGE